MIECSFIAILSVIIINFTKKIYFHIFFDLSIKYSSFQILIFFLICYSLTTRVDTFNAFVSRLSQFSSVIQLCLSLCDLMDCNMPGFPVHHQFLELAQTHVHWVGNVIQPFHPLSSPSPSAFSLSQHQGLFQWVSSSHQVAKVLEFQLQHQSFQWIFRNDFL